MALPIYFALSGVGNTRKRFAQNCVGKVLSLGGRAFASLPGLRLALFVTTFERLVVRFPLDCYKELNGVQRFISRLSKVSELVLNFNLPLEETMTGLREGFDIQELLSLGAICNNLSEKQCTSLSILGAHRDTVYTGPIPNIRPLSTLTCFCLSSPILVYFPFRLWTINSINYSPIRRLIIMDDNPAWNEVLPQLTLPFLSVLFITSAPLVSRGLSSFICRHPTITSLTIVHMSDVHIDLQLQPNALPCLETLRSTPSTAVHFLCSPALLPKLATIDISTHIRSFDSTSIEQVLHELSRPMRNFVATVTSLSFAISQLQIVAWMNADDPCGNRPECQLHHLRNLEVVILMSSDEILNLSVLPKWFALFPALRVITIKHGFSMPSLDMDAPSKVALVKSIAEACSEIETVALAREQKSVVDWLA